MPGGDQRRPLKIRPGAQCWECSLDGGRSYWHTEQPRQRPSAPCNRRPSPSPAPNAPPCRQPRQNPKANANRACEGLELTNFRLLQRRLVLAPHGSAPRAQTSHDAVVPEDILARNWRRECVRPLAARAGAGGALAPHRCAGSATSTSAFRCTSAWRPRQKERRPGTWTERPAPPGCVEAGARQASGIFAFVVK